jgi:hypothetical protein
MHKEVLTIIENSQQTTWPPNNHAETANDGINFFGMLFFLITRFYLDRCTKALPTCFLSVRTHKHLTQSHARPSPDSFLAQ